MATDEKAKVDPQLEKQRAVVEELSRDPVEPHAGDVAAAPRTEHGETSGLKPLASK